MESATPAGRKTLPALDFAPLEAAITARVAIRKQQPGARRRDLNDFLPPAQRQCYYRAARAGRISINHAEQLCDLFGWHPREIWTAREWDQLAEYQASPERERIRQEGRAYRARRKARAAAAKAAA